MNSPAEPRALRIFLVENHPDTRKYLKLYLRALGHTVLEAESVAEAMEKIPGASADVLISDIGLPDGDGWQLLRQLKEAGALPRLCVAMSGFGTGSDRSRSLDAGFHMHLIKPFQPEQLDEVLAEAVREVAPAS